jgi:RHS repeat-associated protein
MPTALPLSLNTINGNEIKRKDQLGHAWSKEYDKMNRVISQTDPLGNTVRTIFDEVGRVQKVISAKGFESINEYDDRGRLSKWIDPEGYEWVYTYDGNTNIIDIKDAKGGHYVMQYGPRNERLFEQNQDGDIWRYTYDPMKRLKTLKTPRNILKTYTYDAGGRIQQVGYSTGRIDALIYDDNNNVESATRSGNCPTVTTQFSYDELNRMVSSTDAYGFTVSYAYDVLSRRTGLVYPCNKSISYKYDKLSRLVKHTDWDDRQMDYTYDKTGKLISKKYPNGIEQKVEYNSSGQLTGLNYAKGLQSPFLVYQYAYDRNGNIASSKTSGLPPVTAPKPSNASFEHTPANKMISKTDVADPNNGFTYVYDDDGNLTEANSPTQSYTLTYDEDNRTKTITWTKDGSTTTIENIYDLTGKRIARIKNGVVTRYVLDMTASYELVLCEANDANSIEDCHIYGNQSLAYSDIASNQTYYHSDASGNIVALTNAVGDTTAQYVYSPYGTILTETDSVNNSYRFAGSVGIMEELPGLFFMRARYYSSDACRFLSTDPLKYIGPGWKPGLYEYAKGNPTYYLDTKGESIVVAAFAVTEYASIFYTASDLAYKYLSGELEPRDVDEAAAAALPDFGALTWVSMHNDIKNKRGLAYAIYKRDWHFNPEDLLPEPIKSSVEDIHDSFQEIQSLKKSLQLKIRNSGTEKDRGDGYSNVAGIYGQMANNYNQSSFGDGMGMSNMYDSSSDMGMCMANFDTPTPAPKKAVTPAPPLPAGDYRSSSYKAKAAKYFGNSDGSTGTKLGTGNHSNNSWLAKRDKYYK